MDQDPLFPHGGESESEDCIARLTDHGFAWEWEILRGDERLYTGAAISEASAKRAIRVTATAFRLTLRWANGSPFAD
ncbi:MAG: hypothetical protein AB7T14_01210 [Candidatus Methylacidiphilaceae bacterium]